MSDADALKIREAFSILTQGIEITQYDFDVYANKATVGTRICWLDSDMYRIFINLSRPTVAERLSGKIPPGLYLRDICEVRPGPDAVNFSRNSRQPNDPDHCLSLIGTEKTFSIEFPSKFSRDWFHKRFILLVDDVLSPEERTAKRFRLWAAVEEVTQEEIAQSQHLSRVLQRGVEVMQHMHSGETRKSVLRYDPNTKQMYLSSQGKGGLFNFTRTETEKIEVDDISEIRVGCHSYGFVRTNSFELDDQALSIISSSWVYDLELIDKASRDLFVSRLHKFLLTTRKTTQSERDYLASGLDDEDEEAEGGGNYDE